VSIGAQVVYTTGAFTSPPVFVRVGALGEESVPVGAFDSLAAAKSAVEAAYLRWVIGREQ
jgi:hypothetical protein